MEEPKLTEAMNALPDSMIAEAMHAQKRSAPGRRIWLLPVACLCALLFAVIGFQNTLIAEPVDSQPPQQNEPPGYPLSEQDLHSTVYASYCPDYAELGYTLYQAEVVCETAFKAIFTSPDSELTIFVDPYRSDNIFLDQLLDVSLAEDGDRPQYRCPVFYAEQFTPECLDFVKIHRTADGGYTVLFNVINYDHFISYVVDSKSPEWINRVFESIARCYQ